MRRVQACALLFMVLVPMLTPGTARAQFTGPEDYDIPNGHFYTQAVPGRTDGSGFMVANATGIPFWDEYQRYGAWQELGYPISKRFIFNGAIAQAFERGVLRWDVAKGAADVLSRDQVRNIPGDARRAEARHWEEGLARHQPWSGWWWSVSGVGPALEAPGGPLSKYDRLVSQITGHDPGTQRWEASELRPAGRGLQWAGHCNGWAAASLLELEPTEPREVGGVWFSVADQKGLLSDYHFADSALWSYGGADDVNPADFHRALLGWLRDQHFPMIMTFNMGSEEVWSYPAFQFQLVHGPDILDPNVTLVEAVVWLADNDVPADFVGVKFWPSIEGKRFTYWLAGPPDNPTDGEFTGANVAGRFARPYQVWYPDANQRNVDRVLAAPELHEEFLRNIVGDERPAGRPT